MFDMNKSLEEQTEPVLRALLNLYSASSNQGKTEEGRQKIIDAIAIHKHKNNAGPITYKRPLKRF